MSIRLGIVMDPIAQINFKKDSSLAMLLAAQARGWSLFYMEQRDLYQSAGQARARMAALTVFNDPQRWFELEEEKDAPLADLDVILMRKDPPFDNEFVYSTYLLEQAERDGVLVVNRPQSLRDCNEKLFATQFPHCMPPTLVSRRPDILREFAEAQRDIILKPLDGMGGSSIFRHRAGDPEARQRGPRDLLGLVARVVVDHVDRSLGERLVEALDGFLESELLVVGREHDGDAGLATKHGAARSTEATGLTRQKAARSRRLPGAGTQGCSVERRPRWPSGCAAPRTGPARAG